MQFENDRSSEIYKVSDLAIHIQSAHQIDYVDIMRWIDL